MTYSVQGIDSNDQTVTLKVNVNEAFKLARVLQLVTISDAFDLAERVDRTDDPVSPYNTPAHDVRRLISLQRLLAQAVNTYNEQ